MEVLYPPFEIGFILESLLGLSFNLILLSFVAIKAYKSYLKTQKYTKKLFMYFCFLMISVTGLALLKRFLIYPILPNYHMLWAKSLTRLLGILAFAFFLGVGYSFRFEEYTEIAMGLLLFSGLSSVFWDSLPLSIVYSLAAVFIAVIGIGSFEFLRQVFVAEKPRLKKKALFLGLGSLLVPASWVVSYFIAKSIYIGDITVFISVLVVSIGILL